ncbi:hypothetical protein GGR51DRAFT_564847 [Nemania sp. FL0031]|nr:hypothetical protein GGR51DRAFT_564847 [Nemania sp. FL0031]
MVYDRRRPGNPEGWTVARISTEGQGDSNMQTQPGYIGHFGHGGAYNQMSPYGQFHPPRHSGAARQSNTYERTGALRPHNIYGPSGASGQSAVYGPGSSHGQGAITGPGTAPQPRNNYGNSSTSGQSSHHYSDNRPSSRHHQGETQPRSHQDNGNRPSSRRHHGETRPRSHHDNRFRPYSDYNRSNTTGRSSKHGHGSSQTQTQGQSSWAAFAAQRGPKFHHRHMRSETDVEDPTKSPAWPGAKGVVLTDGKFCCGYCASKMKNEWVSIQNHYSKFHPKDPTRVTAYMKKIEHRETVCSECGKVSINEEQHDKHFRTRHWI